MFATNCYMDLKHIHNMKEFVDLAIERDWFVRLNGDWRVQDPSRKEDEKQHLLAHELKDIADFYRRGGGIVFTPRFEFTEKPDVASLSCLQ